MVQSDRLSWAVLWAVGRSERFIVFWELSCTCELSLVLFCELSARSCVLASNIIIEVWTPYILAPVLYQTQLLLQSSSMSTESQETTKLIKPARARSPYWEHFGFKVNEKGERLNTKAVFCQLCDKDVNYSQNTTNLRQHLESHHPEVLASSSKAHGVETQPVSTTKKLPTGCPQSTEVTKAIAVFIAKDMRPAAVVEGKGRLCLIISTQ